MALAADSQTWSMLVFVLTAMCFGAWYGQRRAHRDLKSRLRECRREETWAGDVRYEFQRCGAERALRRSLNRMRALVAAAGLSLVWLFLR